jgi:hypothetical protein
MDLHRYLTGKPRFLIAVRATPAPVWRPRVRAALTCQTALSYKPQDFVCSIAPECVDLLLSGPSSVPLAGQMGRSLLVLKLG